LPDLLPRGSKREPEEVPSKPSAGVVTTN